MSKCAKCNNDTNSTFYIKELNGCICGKCATWYAEYKKAEIQTKIHKLQKEIENLMNQAKKAELEDCKHENIVSTGFCKVNPDKKVMKEFICQDCGVKVYKQKLTMNELKSKILNT